MTQILKVLAGPTTEREIITTMMQILEVLGSPTTDRHHYNNDTAHEDVSCVGYKLFSSTKEKQFMTGPPKKGGFHFSSFQGLHPGTLYQ